MREHCIDGIDKAYSYISIFCWPAVLMMLIRRYAQQTDAGQQTKCLLLSPKAVVNVKPNLQIIADDVKCTHGAAISGDLDPNELFYFQARGVDVKTATDALLFSFGAQVINRIPFKPVEQKALAQLKELLTLSRQSN
jgi:Fe-S cluster assembly protein SufD